MLTYTITVLDCGGFGEKSLDFTNSTTLRPQYAVRCGSTWVYLYRNVSHVARPIIRAAAARQLPWYTVGNLWTPPPNPAQPCRPAAIADSKFRCVRCGTMIETPADDAEGRAAHTMARTIGRPILIGKTPVRSAGSSAPASAVPLNKRSRAALALYRYIVTTPRANPRH